MKKLAKTLLVLVLCGMLGFTCLTASATLYNGDITATEDEKNWNLAQNYSNTTQLTWVNAQYVVGSYGPTYNAGSATDINIANGMEGVAYTKLQGTEGEQYVYIWDNMPNGSNWVCSGWTKTSYSDYAEYVIHKGARRYDDGTGKQQFNWKIV